MRFTFTTNDDGYQKVIAIADAPIGHDMTIEVIQDDIGNIKIGRVDAVPNPDFLKELSVMTETLNTYAASLNEAVDDLETQRIELIQTVQNLRRIVNG